MRRGKESGKKQSFKARRDESYGAWGKRKAKFGRKNKVNKQVILWHTLQKLLLVN